MGVLIQLHQEHEKELAASLESCRDAKETADTLRAYWDALRATYMQQLRTERERERVAPLFEAMMEGTACCGAMTHAQLSRTALPTVTLPGKPSPRMLLRRYGVPALCVLASAICILSGETLAALCTLLSAAATGFEALRRSETAQTRAPEEIVSATPLPDEAEMLSRVEKSVDALDLLLLRAERMQEGAGTPAQTLTWTRRELESVQQLWEAYEDSDGEYALKAVPLLLSELSGQEVTLRRYGEGVDESFDLLPGLVSGRTIRPALYAGDKLLLRGQATCEAEKVEVTGL